MERVSVLCLFLLLCSLSGAELQDNEITEQREVGPESANAPEHPQLCPSDVHAVLRDMSVKLAENRLMIQQLQTLNQEQNAKLAKNEDRIEQLQTLNHEQAAKLKEFEKQVTSQQQAQATEVNALRQQQQVQAAELNSIKTRANKTENQVEFLSRDRAVAQVAFSASLLASGSADIGPFNTQTTLVFRHVVSNIGNAYNSNTGFFTAPVRGAYHFELYIGANGHPSISSGAWLVKNGEHICMAHQFQTNGFGTAANGATLLLEVGDVVFVRQRENSIIHDSPNHHTTFSGHLLFPM